MQNFSEVYKLLNRNNLSYKFYNINQFVKSINQSFKQNKNFVKKIGNLKKIGSNILNNTLVEINYFL